MRLNGIFFSLSVQNTELMFSWLCLTLCISGVMEIGIPVPTFSLYSTCMVRKHPEQKEPSTTWPLPPGSSWEQKEESELEEGKSQKLLDPTCRSLETVKARGCRKEQWTRGDRKGKFIIGVVWTKLHSDEQRRAKGMISPSQPVMRKGEIKRARDSEPRKLFLVWKCY